MTKSTTAEEKVNPQFWVLGDLQGNVLCYENGLLFYGFFKNFAPYGYYTYAKQVFNGLREDVKKDKCIYGIRCTLKADGKLRIKDLNWYEIPEGEVLPLDVKATVIKWFNEFIKKETHEPKLFSPAT